MRQGGEAFTLLIISAAFIAGAVGGSLLGSGELSAAEGVLPGDGSVYGSDSYFSLLFSCAKYHLIVLLFSTSLAGVLLIPATLAFRGFALSCTAAFVASAYPEQGIALVLVVLGLPALLTVPSLFIVAYGGELFSARLVSHYVRRPLPPRYRAGRTGPGRGCYASGRGGDRVLCRSAARAAAYLEIGEKGGDVFCRMSSVLKNLNNT